MHWMTKGVLTCNVLFVMRSMTNKARHSWDDPPRGLPMIAGEEAWLVLMTTMLLMMMMVVTMERGQCHHHRYRHNKRRCKLRPGVAVVPSMGKLISIIAGLDAVGGLLFHHSRQQKNEITWR